MYHALLLFTYCIYSLYDKKHIKLINCTAEDELYGLKMYT